MIINKAFLISWVEMEPESILAAVVECIDKAIKRFEMMGRLVSDIKGTLCRQYEGKKNQYPGIDH